MLDKFPLKGDESYKKITVVILLATVIFSCVNSNDPNGFKKSGNGTLYKVHYRGNDTTKITEGEIVTVNIQYRTDDTLIFSSIDSDNPMTFPVIQPTFKGDLYESLTLMGTGDSMSIAVVADSFYLETAKLPSLPEFIKPGSYLYYDIKVIEHLTTQEYQHKKSKEEKVKLQNYINNNDISVEPTESGLYIIQTEKGRGTKTPVPGDMCQIYIEVKELNGNELYSNFGERPLDIEYGKGFDTKGFTEGLGLLHEGETAMFIVPSWLGVGSQGMDGVDAFTTLLYKVKLIAIRTLEEVQADRKRYKEEDEKEKARLKKIEPEVIQNYLKTNNIYLDSTETGLYFKELKSGNGIFPDSGSIVTVEYIHYDLNGNVIQSSYEDDKPFSFVVGTGAVIKGWEEAIGKMSKGSKAWMLIPSKLGYRGYQRTKEIKPYSPLVFELEVTDVK